jgi:hypothetical protein
MKRYVALIALILCVYPASAQEAAIGPAPAETTPSIENPVPALDSAVVPAADNNFMVPGLASRSPSASKSASTTAAMPCHSSTRIARAG